MTRKDLRIESLEQRRLLAAEFLRPMPPVAAPASPLEATKIEAVIETVVEARQSRMETFGRPVQSVPEGLRPDLPTRIAAIRSLPDPESRREFAASRAVGFQLAIHPQTPVYDVERYPNLQSLTDEPVVDAASLNSIIDDAWIKKPTSIRSDVKQPKGVRVEVDWIELQPHAGSLRQKAEDAPFKFVEPALSFDEPADRESKQASPDFLRDRSRQLVVEASTHVAMIALSAHELPGHTSDTFQVVIMPFPALLITIDAVAGLTEGFTVPATAGVQSESIVAGSVDRDPYLLGVAIALSSGVSFQLAINSRIATHIRKLEAYATCNTARPLSPSTKEGNDSTISANEAHNVFPLTEQDSQPENEE